MEGRSSSVLSTEMPQESAWLIWILWQEHLAMPGAMLPRLVEGSARVFIQRTLGSRQLTSQSLESFEWWFQCNQDSQISVR